MDGTKGTILIVDDEEPIRNIICRRLQEEGYNCVTAVNGKDALQQAFMHDLDLVLLDIKMPVMTGMEALPRIITDHPDTSVVMVTAVGDTTTAVEAMKIGAYDYLIKPFHMDDLLTRVRRALERRKLILQNEEYRRRLEQRVQQQAVAIDEYYQQAIGALAQDQITLDATLENTFLQILATLSLMAEMHEPYIRGHSQRVSMLAKETALKLACSKELVREIRLAAKVHDIGKIVIPDHILFKPEPLTPAEYSEVKRHPTAAADIIRHVSHFKGLLPLIESHHESYDGKGYPQGLKGEGIPLGARILAVADAYDAMTCPRPYRPRLSSEEALQVLKRGAGKQWDPRVVNALIQILKQEYKALQASLTEG